MPTHARKRHTRARWHGGAQEEGRAWAIPVRVCTVGKARLRSRERTRLRRNAPEGAASSLESGGALTSLWNGFDYMPGTLFFCLAAPPGPVSGTARPPKGAITMSSTLRGPPSGGTRQGSSQIRGHRRKGLQPLWGPKGPILCLPLQAACHCRLASFSAPVHTHRPLACACFLGCRAPV